MNDAKGERSHSSSSEGGKKGQGKGARLGGGDWCPELMNILMVVCSGIRNLKV